MDDFVLDIENYKEYDRVEAEYNGYTGAIYKDNMFGQEFTNFSLYKDKMEIFHATLINKEYTKEDVIKHIEGAIKALEEMKGE